MILKNELTEQELEIDLDKDEEDGYYPEYSEQELRNPQNEIQFLNF